jgi:hypothetical protein
MLKIEAARGVGDKPIPMTWWDLSVEGFPDQHQQHGEPVQIDKIYLALPVEKRRYGARKPRRRKQSQS